MYVYLSLASPLGGSSRPQAGDEERLPGQSVYGIQRQGRSSSGFGHLPLGGRLFYSAAASAAMAASFLAIAAVVSARKLSSFAASSSSATARIATARYAAFFAPFSATVATGKPLGICTVASRRPDRPWRRPSSGCPQRQGGVGGKGPRQMRRHAGGTDQHPKAVGPGFGGEVRRLGGGPVGR